MKKNRVTKSCLACAAQFEVPMSDDDRLYCRRACYLKHANDFDAKYIVDQETGCWNWTGTITPVGYGKVFSSGKNKFAHRISYERVCGPIPEGLQIDHLCRNRRCVNPAHLEPVTPRENFVRTPMVIAARAATHCPSGHEWTEENTYLHKTHGWRICRQCTRDSQTRYRRKKGIS